VAADGCTVESLAFLPGGGILATGGIDWLATGGTDGAVCLWDVRQPGPVAAFNRGTTVIAVHPAGRQLAEASLTDTICVWDVDGQRLAFELSGHSDTVTCVVYHPEGRWLASGADDRTIRLWNTETGEAAAIHELDTPIKALCFSPDGRSLFTGNGNTTSYQLDVRLLLEEARPGTLAGR
jgi:WD40 repeat protein